MRYLFILLLLCSLQAPAQTTGTIISVHDGDSYTLLACDSIRIKLRLYGIDCPELHQAYGKEARDFVKSLILGKRVQVISRGFDNHGRTLAIIKTEYGELNALLVATGNAWHYLHYDTDEKYSALERNARLTHRGLWADSTAIAPWDFRHHSKQ